MTAVPDPLSGGLVDDLVVRIGNPVTTSEVDTYKELRAADDRSLKLRTILDAWQQQQNQDRDMRKTYGRWLLIALFVQMLLVNASFIMIGFKVMSVDAWVAKTFIVAVFAELAAMIVIIVKYLFPDKSDAIVNILEKL